MPDISFGKRLEAENARSSLRDLWRIFGEKVKVSWSPGKGIKDGYKSWDWDQFTGICKIPVTAVPLNVKSLLEGSELVEDSVPDALKARFSGKEDVEPQQQDSPEILAAEELAAAPVPQLPVMSLPIAAHLNPPNQVGSGWQASAAFGFNPKVNPWTGM